MSDQKARLYIGGLPWAVRDDELRQIFEQAGTVVDAYVAIERGTGRSRGFGFVEMGSPEEAEAAIEMWHEKDYNGRYLVVNLAKPKV